MAMLKKGTKAYSIYHLKCPRCQEADLFKTATWSFQQPFDMHDRCPQCDLNLMPEPGFYWGAMFISYIIWGWLSLGLVGGMMWGFGMGVNGAFALLLFISAIFFIPLFRISRSIWININVKYDAAKARAVQAKQEH